MFSIFQIVKTNATAANQDDSVNEVFASAVQFGRDDSVVEVVDSGNMDVFALWPVVFYKKVLVFSNTIYFGKAYLSYFL